MSSHFTYTSYLRLQSRAWAVASVHLWQLHLLIDLPLDPAGKWASFLPLWALSLFHSWSTELAVLFTKNILALDHPRVDFCYDSDLSLNVLSSESRFLHCLFKAAHQPLSIHPCLILILALITGFFLIADLLMQLLTTSLTHNTQLECKLYYKLHSTHCFHSV